MGVLDDTAAKVAAVLQKTRGATEVKVEQTTGLPMLSVDIDRQKLARYGLNVSDLQDTIATAIGGTQAGTLFRGDRRFAIVVRLPEAARADLDALRRLPIALPLQEGANRISYVPLAEVATLNIAPGPNQVSREDGKRRIVVSANVRGRDLGSFVADAEQALQAQVRIPTGYWTAWGGQFENQQRASARLMLVIPIALLLIFFVLLATLRSLRASVIILLNIPFAMVGGLVSLWASGEYLSVPASVGFIALLGIAVLNGLVLVAYFRQLREEGATLADAVRLGAERRLRPVLMTASITAFGLVPLLFASGPGSEIQKPLAIVVIGGLITSTLLTLVLLPILFERFGEGREEAAND
jgi:cobalt-zinc-cadmium resistance protein CzcA